MGGGEREDIIEILFNHVFSGGGGGGGGFWSALGLLVEHLNKWPRL